MAQNTAGSIPGAAPVAIETAIKPVTAGERAFRQAVSTAVRQLNEQGNPGIGREVTYSIDPVSRRPVVRLIESQTKEVIAQWPNQYALELAAENRKTQESE
jgi:uncharacterized FlaG/YvyC family protein